jgi:hypothetical protein
MKSIQLSRRSLLRGVAGATLALPWLEAMEPRQAMAQTRTPPPKRYVVLFGGTSLGRNDTHLLVPSALGPNYPTNTALAPLDTRGVKSHVGIVSNLVIPISGPASRPPLWHASSTGVLLSGVTATSRSPAALGPTSDWIVASRLLAGLAPAARPRADCLTWRVQAEGYISGGATGIMSARRNPSTGALEQVSPIASPQVIFRNLFGSAAGSDPTAAARADMNHQSVLDFVAGRASDLSTRVSASDRLRIQQHLDEVRDLERSVAALATSTCAAPPDPGPDPATSFQTQSGTTTGATIGYSNERRRGELLAEMLYLALACDISRAASLMLSFSQSFMNCAPLLGGLPNGAQIDVHNASHTGLLGLVAMKDVMARCIGWHVDVFAHLVARLASATDGTGTLLDHTAVVLGFEGGMGHDYESGNNGVAHSSEGMCMLYAGAGLRPGVHTDGAHAHPSRVTLAAMRAVGVPDPLGEITTPFAGLL